MTIRRKSPTNIFPSFFSSCFSSQHTKISVVALLTKFKRYFSIFSIFRPEMIQVTLTARDKKKEIMANEYFEVFLL